MHTLLQQRRGPIQIIKPLEIQLQKVKIMKIFLISLITVHQ